MTSSSRAPEPPASLGLAPRGRGRRLWRETHEAHDVDHLQRLLLEEACRTADRLDDLHELVRDEGPASTAARHARDTAASLARLLAAMRLPDERTGKRPQRRGTRGAQQPSHLATVSALDRARGAAG